MKDLDIIYNNLKAGKLCCIVILIANEQASTKSRPDK